MLTAVELWFGITPAHYIARFIRDIARFARILTVRTGRIIAFSFNRAKGRVTLYPIFDRGRSIISIKVQGSEGEPWRVVIFVHDQDLGIDWEKITREVFPPALSVLVTNE